MKKWVISCILTLGIQVSLCTGEESIRKFRTIDPIQLEKKVPVGYDRSSCKLDVKAILIQSC